MDERDLDAMLMKRHVPPAPSNLAHRIIEASLVQDVAPRRSGGFGRWLNGFLEGFALPQPALAIGLFLLIGIGLGVLGQDISLLPLMDVEDFSMAFEGEDFFETGDFL